MRHNKLVRDKIPEIIAEHGERPVMCILDDVGYKQELKKKLHEEFGEFDQSESIEELADILEIIHALASVDGIDHDRLEAMRQEKRKERGGFDRRIFLIGTLSPEEHE
jgi:predicted house-cleaning noncanonical NTP pyrophosphatase (MazG superfamily)